MKKFSFISLMFLLACFFVNFIQAGTGNLQSENTFQSVDIYEMILSAGIIVDTSILANSPAKKLESAIIRQSAKTQLRPDHFVVKTTDPIKLPVLENDDISVDFKLEIVGNPLKGTASVQNNNISYIPSEGKKRYSDTITYKVGSINDPETYFISKAIVDFKPEKNSPALEEFRVYPNPTSSYINVFLPGKGLVEYEIVIVDPSGKEILRKKNIYSSFPFRFNVEGLEKGVYLVQIITEDNSISRKIIVN